MRCNNAFHTTAFDILVHHCLLWDVATVCALIFTGFNVHGFRGSAAIRENFVREHLDINRYAL